MTLVDLRKLTIRKQFRVRFTLKDGLECVINERGLAQVPALKSIPEFNLEQELAGVRQFLLEPLVSAGEKNPAKPRSVSRDELDALTKSSPGSAAAHDDHEDE